MNTHGKQTVIQLPYHYTTLHMHPTGMYHVNLTMPGTQCPQLISYLFRIPESLFLCCLCLPPLTLLLQFLCYHFPPNFNTSAICHFVLLLRASDPCDRFPENFNHVCKLVQLTPPAQIHADKTTPPI